MDNSILQLFPLQYRGIWQRTAKIQDSVQEIRLRAGRPVVLHRNGSEVFLDRDGKFIDICTDAYTVTERVLEEILEHICHYSPYAFEEDLKRGFVTVAGGHRVGGAGQAVLEPDGSIRTLKNISFLNIRVSHQKKGAADKVLPRMYRKGSLKNALIISPPGCGKTTLLRDLIRQVSDGNGYGRGMTVGVVDERSELAGSFLGRPQNDVNLRHLDRLLHADAGYLPRYMGKTGRMWSTGFLCRRTFGTGCLKCFLFWEKKKENVW